MVWQSFRIPGLPTHSSTESPTSPDDPVQRRTTGVACPPIQQQSSSTTGGRHQ